MSVGATNLVTGTPISIPKPLYGGMSDDLSLKQFLSRPVKITETSISPSSVGYTFRPMKVWLQNSAVIEKLKYFRLVRGKPKLQIMVNSYPFNYGQFSMAADYELYGNPWVIEPTYGQLNVVQSLQAPHTLIDLGRSAIYEMPLDWATLSGWHDITGDTEGNHGFVSQYMPIISLVPVVPLASSRADPPLDVNILVYFTLEDIELSGPTDLGTVTVLQSAFGHEPFSQSLEEAADMTETMGDVIPPLKGVMTPAALALKMGAKLAKMMGYSSPEGPPQSAVLTNHFANHFSYSDAPHFEPKLTSFPGQATAVSPDVAGFGSSNDMIISDIVGRYGLVDLLSWPESGVNTSMRISPMNQAAPYSGMSFTPLSWISQLFVFWSGSLKYRVEVVASPFHRGVLGVSVGYGKQVVTDTDTLPQTQRTFFIDLSGENRILEFEVPFLASVSALPTDEDGMRDSMGQLNFFEAIPLKSEGGNPVTIKIEVAGGSDYMLYVPTTRYISEIEELAHPFLTLQSTQESEVEVDEVAENVAINGPSPGSHMAIFGEKFTSIKQIMDKHVLKDAFVDTVPTPAGTNEDMSYALVLKPRYSPITGFGPWTGSGAVSHLYRGLSFVDYLRVGFLGERGGMKYKITTSQRDTVVTSANAPASVGMVWYNGPDTVPLTQKVVQTATGPGIMPWEVVTDISGTSLATYNPTMNNAIEYYTPYFLPFNVSPARAYWNDGINVDVPWGPYVHVRLGGGQFATETTPVFFVHEAAGDDYALFKFMYVPKYTRITPPV